MNKSILNRIWCAIKLGWKLPNLPVSVSKFHNYPLVRIFRLMGGVSIVLFLSPYSSGWLENYLLYWIIFSLAMLQFLYIFIISIVKIFYIFYLWKNKKLEVRNSPLDQVASLTLKLATCIKGGCVAGAGTATIFGLGFGADKLLEEAGYSPVFKKAVGKQLGNILSSMGYQNNNEYSELKNKILEIRQRTKNIEELNKIVDHMEKDESFSGIKEDLKEFLKELNKEKDLKSAGESKILKS